MAQDKTRGQSKYPVKWIQVLRGGTAHVILFSDGKKYVVKWNATRKDRYKEVVNEYVVGKLAGLLSLPVVPQGLVYIPKEFIRKTPALHSKKYTFRSGYQYGCVFIENCDEFKDVIDAPPSKKEVKNREMLAGITVFDQWVNNTDRGIRNLLLERLGEGRYYVHMIDHGRCFPGRYEWSARTLSEKPKYTIHWPIYKWTFSLLDNSKELTSFAKKIKSLPNKSIFEVIQSIPKEWKVSTEDRKALYKFFLKQKSNLSGIVASIIKYHSKNT